MPTVYFKAKPQRAEIGDGWHEGVEQVSKLPGDPDSPVGRIVIGSRFRAKEDALESSRHWADRANAFHNRGIQA